MFTYAPPPYAYESAYKTNVFTKRRIAKKCAQRFLFKRNSISSIFFWDIFEDRRGNNDVSPPYPLSTLLPRSSCDPPWFNPPTLVYRSVLWTVSVLSRSLLLLQISKHDQPLSYSFTPGALDLCGMKILHTVITRVIHKFPWNPAQ